MSHRLLINVVLGFLMSYCVFRFYQILPCLEYEPSTLCHGPLARYIKLRVAHAPGMPGTFSPPPRVSDPDMHQGTCVTHVPWCMPGSLTSGFLWSRWQGKRSRYSRRMRNPYFYVSGKRPMGIVIHDVTKCTYCLVDQCYIIFRNI